MTAYHCINGLPFGGEAFLAYNEDINLSEKDELHL
jgi:hypothetical protein